LAEVDVFPLEAEAFSATHARGEERWEGDLSSVFRQGTGIGGARRA
jgi:hypothetical protein